MRYDWFFILITIFVIVEYYSFQVLKNVFPKHFKKIFWLFILGFWSLIFAGIFSFVFRFGSLGFRAPVIAIFFIFKVPQIFLAIILAVEDVSRWSVAGIRNIRSLISDGKEEKYIPTRRKFVAQAGLALVTIPFAGVIYGITKGKYNFKIHTIELTFPDWPAALEGFKITQLSDFHIGSFEDRDEVLRGIDMANALGSDMVVFTGDTVNNRAEELESWIEILSRLHAPLGKFSILGNHDYGDYVRWDSDADKNRNMERLVGAHKEMGFDLLRNENRIIQKDESRFSLVGVENWGLPPFPQKGDLKKALAGVDEKAFKILLSHDPTHWESEVISHAAHIPLTLSGHTHGMQFGVEISGFKWSPVQYRYPRWAGIYTEGSRYLYVNRGFGFIGLPGRVGIWPEITQVIMRRG